MSDDTQLTLATCQALRRRGAVDPGAIAEQFRRWFVEGRFSGLGSGTLKALRDLQAGAHWALAGARGEYAAGAGAAMRAAPLAALLEPRRDQDRRTLRDVCRITHHSDEAYAGALAVVLALQDAAAGYAGQRLLFSVIRALPDTGVRDRLEELFSMKGPRDAAALGTSGHVVDAVPLALFLAANATGVGSVIQCAISQGGDTDTIAALAAQITAARGLPVPAELWDQVKDANVMDLEFAAFCDS